MIPNGPLEVGTMTPVRVKSFCLIAFTRFLSGEEEVPERSTRFSSCGVEDFPVLKNLFGCAMDFTGAS